MKLTCTYENLKRAIFNSERIVSKQNTLPILNNILFETEKGGLKLSATNLEMGVTVKIGAKIEEDGKITIPAKVISTFINNLSTTDFINIETVDNNLKIKTKKSKTSIKGLSAEEFPLIPKKNNEYQIKIDSFLFKEMVLKVLTSVAMNEVRPELTGINFLLKDNRFFWASTDSFRLTEITIDSNENFLNKDAYQVLISKMDNFIIPAVTLLEVSRIIPSEEESFVFINIEEGQIFFTINDTVLVSRLINGKYPEYKHILPKDFKTRIVCEKKDLQSAIKMASIFSSSKNNEISFKIDSKNKKISIESRSAETGENVSEVNFDSLGPSQEATLNAKYFLDGINIAKTSKVAVLINSGSTPIAIKEINEQTGEVLDGFIYILMPIKN